MDKSRYTLRGWPLSDYIDFTISVGSVLGAFLLTLAFTIAAIIKHVPVPQEVYAVPIGFGMFFMAYVWDGLAHRSIYKDKIDKQELFVHHFMVFYSGFPLFVSFVLAYWLPGLMLSFIVGFLFLKTMYSLYDEFAFHWPRFRQGRSDMIEMSAHWMQFLSNVVYDVGFLYLIYWNKYECVKAIFR
jgi:hypothetical protein